MLVEASFLGDLKVGEEDWKMGGANIKVDCEVGESLRRSH
jgi:hypothetical protein